MNWNRSIAALSAVACLCLSLLTANSFADTNVSGNVSGEWTVDGSPYIVTGSITLPRNDSLVIEPGVTVRFNNNTGFVVQGVLSAVGMEGDSIRFVSSGRRPRDYESIRIEGNGAFGSVMAYCVIQHTEWGLHIVDSDPDIRHCNISFHYRSCVRLEGSRANITYCNISDATGRGILVQDNSRPKVRYCTIRNFAGDGILVEENSSPVVDGNLIFGADRYGIYLNEAGVCSLKYNIVDHCEERGIYGLSTNQTIILRNIVTFSRGSYALNLHRCQNVLLANNTVIENEQSGFGIISTSGLVYSNIALYNGNDGFYMQDAQFTLQYNNSYLNNNNNYTGMQPDGTNMSVDPQLNQNYTPVEGSRMIDAGHPAYRDLDGTRADIGARFFNQNHPPVIDSYSPDNFDRLDNDEEITFSIQASDPDGHALIYKWYVNGEEVVASQTSYSRRFVSNGDYSVMVVVDDRYYMGRTSHTWDFEVALSVEEVHDLPSRFSLNASYPNPFNETTRFTIRSAGMAQAHITLWNTLGEPVKEIWSGTLRAGSHEFTVNSSNLSNGLYILKARLGDQTLERKVVYMK